MNAAHTPKLRIGALYNWINQPERLVYVGRHPNPGQHRWHQFEKVDAPGVIWCEVPDSDLHMLEESRATLPT